MNLLILGSIITILTILYLLVQQRNRARNRKKLEQNWGKKPEEPMDIDSAKIFFTLTKTNPIVDSYCVDEDTWHDLNFDTLFPYINRTLTPIGSQYLFFMLRHPVLQAQTLGSRETLIQHFAKDQKLREKVQLALLHLKNPNARYLPYSLWRPLPVKPFYAHFLPVLSLLATAILLLVLLKILHFGVLLVIFTLHLVIRFIIKRKMDAHVHAFQYLGILIRTAEQISTFKRDELKEIRASLLKNLATVRKLPNRLFALQLKDELGFVEYLNIYFLWDILGFYSAIGKIEKHLQELRQLFEIIGYLDALISIASFRLDYPNHCLPIFSSNAGKYRVQGIYHPLLTQPIANSFEFHSKNVLITGSNMAGKTTFLKTMGVNAILAQTIHMAMAEAYQAPFLKVLSSIGREDNLVTGKSYYLAEVESILRLIEASKSDAVHLLILDEIFRGTNSIERLAAAAEVLDFLANQKDFILVATHDLQLCELLNHKFHNFHFREKVSDQGLAFDYKIQSGKSTSRNAIALLKFVGYPQTIVTGAARRIDDNGNNDPEAH